MIWCVEDDVSIRDIEIYTLEQTGFTAKGFCDGDSFWVELATTDELPELVILDIMLLGEDGVSLLKKIKASSRTRDDYLVKPFGMMEMVSRIKAVLRRCMPKKENKTVYVNDQGRAVKEIFENEGFKEVVVKKDLCENDRVVMAVK